MMGVYQAVCTYLLLMSLYCAEGEVKLMMNKKIPIEYESLRLSCVITESENIDDITFYTLRNNKTSAGFCHQSTPRCTGDSSPYEITTDNQGIHLDIKTLKRTRDESNWVCRYGRHGKTFRREEYVTVYTIPSGLVFRQGGNESVDLSKSSLNILCETDGCTYPTPIIKWYFKDMTQSSARRIYNGSRMRRTETPGKCSLPEKIYRSYLYIPINSWWPDDSYETVLFSCGIEYNESSRNIFSQDSEKITYAAVGEEKDQSDHAAVTIPVLIVIGTATTLFCVTIITIVIVLNKRRQSLANTQNGNIYEDDETHRNQTRRTETRTTVGNDISYTYESLRRDVEEDNQYTGMQNL